MALKSTQPLTEMSTRSEDYLVVDISQNIYISGWCKQFGRFPLYTILSQLFEVYEKHLEICQSGQTESECRTFMDPGGQVS